MGNDRSEAWEMGQAMARVERDNVDALQVGEGSSLPHDLSDSSLTRRDRS